MPKAQFFDLTQDYGIYTNIQETDLKDKTNHKLYSCLCKSCGNRILRNKHDILTYNKICQHNDLQSKYLQITDEEKQEYSFKVFGILCKNSKRYIRSGKVYDMWRHMIYRTNPKYWKKYPTYKGTTVSEDWLDYSKFYDDIKELEGYDLFINNTKNRGVMLDKDTIIPGNKHYSKETCCFLSHADSNRDVISRHPEMNFQPEMIEHRKKQKTQNGRKIKAINKRTHEEVYFYSIKDCGKYIHTNPANIQMCLSDLPQYEGHYSCKGYIFEEVSKEEFENNLDKVITYEIKETPNKPI